MGHLLYLSHSTKNLTRCNNFQKGHVDIPFPADWLKIGEYRQKTDKNTDRENSARADWDYQPSNKLLLHKDVPSTNQKAGMKVISLNHPVSSYEWHHTGSTWNYI